jgi:hypothetical protein
MINLRKTFAAVALAISGFLSFQTALGPGLAAELQMRRPPQNEAIERFRRDQGLNLLPPAVRDKVRREFEPSDRPAREGVGPRPGFLEGWQDEAVEAEAVKRCLKLVKDPPVPLSRH